MTVKEALEICKEEMRIHNAFKSKEGFLNAPKCKHTSDDFGEFLEFIKDLLEKEVKNGN